MLTMTDAGKLSIGEKRQIMLHEATAEWVSFVDDDDMVPENHVRRILKAMNPDVDVIGWRLRYFVNTYPVGYAIHSYNAERHAPPKDANANWTRFDRLPNHLNAVRRRIALRVGYKPLKTGEDGDYAYRLSRLGPRPREAFIDAPMYDYLDRDKK